MLKVVPPDVASCPTQICPEVSEAEAAIKLRGAGLRKYSSPSDTHLHAAAPPAGNLLTTQCPAADQDLNSVSLCSCVPF